MKKICKLEFHSHTAYSPDSLTEIDDFIASCRKKGIDRVVITDHNTIAGALLAYERAPDLVIVGEEIKTSAGELLAAFVQEPIPAYLSPEKGIELLRSQGAFISISHPFDRRGGGWDLNHLQEIAELVDAIEIYNSRCIPQSYNLQAMEFAKKLGLVGTVGSDAHTTFELGRSYMLIPTFNNAAELKAVIGKAEIFTQRSGIAVRFASRYATLKKKFFPT